VNNIFGDLTGVLLLSSLVAVLMFGFVMDAYAVFLRVAGIEGLAEILAMSNLVQYLARISNVLVIFILSFAFETGRLIVPVSLIFFLSSILGIITVFALIKSRVLCNLVRSLLLPILYPSFKQVAKISVWRDTGHFNRNSVKLAVYSALTNTLIVVAMYIPFGIAALYPEMRMTSVYFGQLMNFFATLLVFAIQDPISMRLIDAGNLKEAGTSLLFGRVFSYCLTAIFFFSLMAFT
jgi:hypothetical protein